MEAAPPHKLLSLQNTIWTFYTGYTVYTAATAYNAYFTRSAVSFNIVQTAFDSLPLSSFLTFGRFFLHNGSHYALL